MSRKEIDSIQLKKIKSIVKHAYETVPYYNALFKKYNLKPEHIKTLNDIDKIPITSKKDLLGLDKGHITSNIFPKSELADYKTSGTSGEPFEFYLDKGYKETITLNYNAILLINGCGLTGKRLVIAGNHDDVRVSKNPFKRWFFERVQLSALRRPEEIAEFCNIYKPKIIEGYVSSLYTLALWLEENRFSLIRNPRLFFCSAEVAHDFMKEKVTNILQTKVVDTYTTAELGIVAAQCQKGKGYHIFENSVFAELIEIDKTKYFVGTNLENYATPFIRYNTQDACDPWYEEELCPCGLKTKKIKNIIGRDNDFIQTPKGELISPMTLIYLMRNYYSFLDSFRFVQQDLSSLRVELVRKKDATGDFIAELAEKLKEITKGLVPDIIEVNDIPRDKSGKMRIIRSNI